MATGIKKLSDAQAKKTQGRMDSFFSAVANPNAGVKVGALIPLALLSFYLLIFTGATTNTMPHIVAHLKSDLHSDLLYYLFCTTPAPTHGCLGCTQRKADEPKGKAASKGSAKGFAKKR